MIEKSCFALKFEMTLGGEKSFELIAESDVLRQIATVLKGNKALFDQSSVKLFEYLLLSI